MRALALLSAFLALPGCDGLFDDRPDYYVEGLRRDLFLSIPLELPGTAVTANVLFRTRKPLGAPVMLTGPVRVVSFSSEGDNIYNGTLGESVIEAPNSSEDLWDWAGSVPFPAPVFPGGGTGARRIGVEIRPGLLIEGFRAAAIAGEFCDVDVLGSGVRACGPWIEALLQLAVRCRGSVQEIIDCHGLSYVLLPAIAVVGIASPSPLAPELSMESEATALFTSNLYLYLAGDGWRYKRLSPHDFYQRKFPSLDDRVSFGPFAEPEEAARHAAETLGLPPGPMYAALVASCDPASGIGRAAATLRDLLHSPRVPKFPHFDDNPEIKDP
jgi:hypothetical protein